MTFGGKLPYEELQIKFDLQLYGRYGILSNNMRSLCAEYYTTFWMMTIYSDTLNWSGITPVFYPVTDLDLITDLTSTMLSIHNPELDDYLGQMFPVELEI